MARLQYEIIANRWIAINNCNNFQLKISKINLSLPLDANSSIFGFVGAPLGVALFHRRAMCATNSSLNSSVGAPLVAALFHLRTVCDTNSSLNSSVGAPRVAALFHLRAVRDTYFSLNSMVVAPLVATLFPAPDTNSSLNGLFSASATLAMFTHRVTTKKMEWWLLLLSIFLKINVLSPRLHIPVFRNLFLGTKKPFLTGFLRISFFPAFSGGIFHRNVVLERLQEFSFFPILQEIFAGISVGRNSCGQEFLYLPKIPPDSGGFRRIPVPAKD